MVEQDSNLMNGQDNRELWPDRYYVTAQNKWIVYEGKIYQKVDMKLFQPNMPEEEAQALLEPLGFSPEMEDYPDIKSQAEETFSKQQFIKLLRNLEYFGIYRVDKKPAYKPQKGRVGLGARDSEFKRDLITLLHPGHYPDPYFGFEVWAYFGDYMKLD